MFTHHQNEQVKTDFQIPLRNISEYSDGYETFDPSYDSDNSVFTNLQVPPILPKRTENTNFGRNLGIPPRPPPQPPKKPPFYDSEMTYEEPNKLQYFPTVSEKNFLPLPPEKFLFNDVSQKPSLIQPSTTSHDMYESFDDPFFINRKTIPETFPTNSPVSSNNTLNNVEKDSGNYNKKFGVKTTSNNFLTEPASSSKTPFVLKRNPMSTKTALQKFGPIPTSTNLESFSLNSNIKSLPKPEKSPNKLEQTAPISNEFQNPSDATYRIHSELTLTTEKLLKKDKPLPPPLSRKPKSTSSPENMIPAYLPRLESTEITSQSLPYNKPKSLLPPVSPKPISPAQRSKPEPPMLPLSTKPKQLSPANSGKSEDQTPPFGSKGKPLSPAHSVVPTSSTPPLNAKRKPLSSSFNSKPEFPTPPCSTESQSSSPFRSVKPEPQPPVQSIKTQILLSPKSKPELPPTSSKPKPKLKPNPKSPAHDTETKPVAPAENSKSATSSVIQSKSPRQRLSSSSSPSSSSSSSSSLLKPASNLPPSGIFEIRKAFQAASTGTSNNEKKISATNLKTNVSEERKYFESKMSKTANEESKQDNVLSRAKMFEETSPNTESKVNYKLPMNKKPF